MRKLISILMVLTFILSGCGAQDEGFFHNGIVQPFTDLITFFARFFDGSFGMGIVLVTLCVRFLLMPMMISSFKNQKKMQASMKVAQPKIKAIQEKIKSVKDPEEKNALSQELMKIYGEHNINPLNIGCLPIIVQMPILTGLYFAITHSKAIAAQSFMWFNLGTPDVWMMLIAGALYFVQSWISIQYMPEESRKQMWPMAIMSPLMIVFVSFHSPAALPLYWSVGAIVLIFQQYISNKLFSDIR
ncbi:membrane protein insertase YidC [Macrococcus animalis]|uniref:membrane protein insertase YidC n=1 Tax=Macrococcus animalis TaxID=3395467 RepID=UPI0039BE8949